MNKKNFSLNKNQNFEYVLDQGVFAPTATTNFLINAVLSYCNVDTNYESVLDLGCGSGIVGLILSKKLDIKKIYASDFSIPAIENTKKNFKYHQISGNIRYGSLLDPWKNEKFDLIVNDISGISSIVAKLSPWFKDVPCESGEDGTDLTIKVLNKVNDHLKPGGLLFFPIISFSNVKKIEAFAKEKFTDIKLISSNSWPFPSELKIPQNILEDLHKKNFITYEEKFGIKLAFTNIYLVKKNDY